MNSVWDRIPSIRISVLWGTHTTQTLGPPVVVRGEVPSLSLRINAMRMSVEKSNYTEVFAEIELVPGF